MAVFNEDRLRSLVGEEVRRVLREEMRPSPTEAGEYLPVAGAASVAAVTPDTIRVWIGQGRLGRYSAGRELRVKRSELEAFLRAGTTRTKSSPEEEAQRFLARRATRGRMRAVG
jgi:excisionase family DNA binding protein